MKFLLTAELHRLFGRCPLELALPDCSAQRQGHVARQPLSPCPSEAPKNVQNSKSFHVENAVESLVAASVGV